MRTFAEYRKRELLSKKYLVSVRESLNLQFEALRIDLLEAANLPELLFENSIDANASYNLLKKDDRKNCQLIIDQFISECKSSFYETLIREAAAATMANPQANVEMELVSKVKEMIQGLRDQIGAVLSTSRSAPNQSPTSSAGTSKSSPMGGGRKSAPSPIPDEDFDDEGDFEPAPTHRTSARPQGNRGHSPDAYSINPKPYDGTTFPTDEPSNFTPAKYGSFKPADGVWSGIKRLAGSLIPRSIRRVWHNHPVRPMAKEQVLHVENVLLENTDQIDKIIDQFEKELLIYISDRIKTMSANTSANIPLAPTAKTGRGKKGGTPVNPNVAGAVPTDPNASPANAGAIPDALTGDGQLVDIGSQQPEDAARQAPSTTDPKVTLGTGTTPVEQAAKQGNQQAQQQIASNLENFKSGAEALGMSVEGMDNRWRGSSFPRHKLKLDGIPLQATGADGKKTDLHTRPELAKKIYERIFTMVMKQPAPKETKGLSEKVKRAVHQFLGIANDIKMNTSGESMVALLLKLGKMLKGNQIGPNGQMNFAHQPEAPATATPGTATSATGLPPEPARKPPVMSKPGAPVASNVGASTTASTGWPNNAAAFAAKFENDYPEGWAKTLELMGGNKTTLLKWLDKTLKEAGPDELFQTMASALKKKGVELVAPVKPTDLTQPNSASPEVMPTGTAGNSAQKPPVSSATPPVSSSTPTVKNSLARNFMSALQQHAQSSPAHQKSYEAIADHLSYDEIEEVLSKLSPEEIETDETIGMLKDLVKTKMSGAAERLGSEDADAGGVPSSVPPVEEKPSVSPTPNDNGIDTREDKYKYNEEEISKRLGQLDPNSMQMIKALLGSVAEEFAADDQRGSSAANNLVQYLNQHYGSSMTAEELKSLYSPIGGQPVATEPLATPTMKPKKVKRGAAAMVPEPVAGEAPIAPAAASTAPVLDEKAVNKEMKSGKYDFAYNKVYELLASAEKEDMAEQLFDDHKAKIMSGQMTIDQATADLERVHQELFNRFDSHEEGERELTSRDAGNLNPYEIDDPKEEKLGNKKSNDEKLSDEEKEDRQLIRGGKGKNKKNNKPKRGGKNVEEVLQSALDDFVKNIFETSTKSPRFKAKDMLLFS